MLFRLRGQKQIAVRSFRRNQERIASVILNLDHAGLRQGIVTVFAGNGIFHRGQIPTVASALGLIQKIRLADGVGFVHDITSDKQALDKLVSPCNLLELSAVHLMDVVEDFLAG